MPEIKYCRTLWQISFKIADSKWCALGQNSGHNIHTLVPLLIIIQYQFARQKLSRTGKLNCILNNENLEPEQVPIIQILNKR